MEGLKNAGKALLVMQCSFNLLTVLLFLFVTANLHALVGRILVFGGLVLSIPTIGIFGYATQREQTYEKSSNGEPEGGRIAQRDLTFCIVSFVSECLTIYWIL